MEYIAMVTECVGVMSILLPRIYMHNFLFNKRL
jgi:hypothetical protein